MGHATEPHPTVEPHPYTPTPAVTAALSSSSALSLIGCALVIGTYIAARRLRRHPASLVVVRSVVDLAFCAEVVASHLMVTTAVDDDCRIYSFVTQFLAIAAELYSLVQALDLLISTSNPFTNWQANLRFYHVFVVVVSALTASLVLFLHDGVHPVYGRDSFLGGVCWIRRGSSEELPSSERAAGAGLGIYLWFLFVVPLFIIYGISTAALCLARRRLARGLPETFEARLAVFKTSSRVVACYVGYWGVAILVYWVMSVVLKGGPPIELSLVLSFALGSRGIVTCGVWYLTYGNDLLPERGCFGGRGCCQRYTGKGGDNIRIGSVSGGDGGIGGHSLGIFDEDNADLRPHLNNALRKVRSFSVSTEAHYHYPPPFPLSGDPVLRYPWYCKVRHPRCTLHDPRLQTSK